MSIEIRDWFGKVMHTSTAGSFQAAVEEAKAAGVDLISADLRAMDPDFAAKQASDREFLQRFNARTRALGMAKKSRKNNINADTAY